MGSQTANATITHHHKRIFMATFLLLFMPFAMDIVIGLTLFVGRHSLAAAGYSQTVVGTLPLLFGIGYLCSSFFMGKIVTKKHAKMQTHLATGLIMLASIFLFFSESLLLTQMLFLLFSFASSLYFVAYQSFMLDISSANHRPLTQTVARYTFAWSAGFALGPLVTALVKPWGDWNLAYLAGAAVALLAAVAAACIKKGHPGRSITKPVKAPATSVSLCGPSWGASALTGGIWGAVLVYWPVQASSLGFSAASRGTVEFSVGMTQALGALLIASIPLRHHRPWWTLVFTFCAVVGLVFFSEAQSVAFFTIGAALYGLLFASSLTNMVYHSMYNPSRSVKRVAINEVIMGTTFMSGPLLAMLLSARGVSAATAYRLFALLLFSGMSALTVWALHLKNHGLKE